MKKIITLVTGFFILITLASCDSSTIDNNLIEYEYRYFSSVQQSAITAQSWDNASQISPESLVDFFGNRTGLNRLSTDAGPAVIAGDIVEPYIQLYFMVDNDYIRQAMSYDSQNKTYEISIPSAGAASARVTAVSEKDDIISLSYEYYSASDDATVIREGTLDIRIQGPVPDMYTYISCSTTSL